MDSDLSFSCNTKATLASAFYHLHIATIRRFVSIDIFKKHFHELLDLATATCLVLPGDY